MVNFRAGQFSQRGELGGIIARLTAKSGAGVEANVSGVSTARSGDAH
jgi:hypothetical protein